MQSRLQHPDSLQPGGYFVPPPRWHQRRELRIFVVVFLLTLSASLSYCFSRTPVYRSTASLTLLGDQEIDRYWHDNGKAGRPAEQQNGQIAVQSRVLMNPGLLRKVWETLSDNPALPSDSMASFSRMQTMLSVHPQPDSLLVELRADGPEPYLLPAILATWINTYRVTRAQNIDDSASSASLALTDQLQTLKAEIRVKRSALETFKQRHGIMSGVRNENPELSKLVGLNEALNKANEEAARARAQRDSATQAVTRGERVFLDNSNNRENLGELEKSAQLLREKMTRLEQQYTPEYIKMVPDLKAVPEQLRAVEARIASIEKMDQERVLATTSQDARAAEQKVQRLQQQLDAFKKSASEFSARFNEYQEQETALKLLETRYRDTEDRILKTRIHQHQKFPDIEVVSEPYIPANPISPDNTRDSLIALAGSLGLALFAVWLARVLVPPAPLEAPGITLAGIHMYGDASQSALPAATPVTGLDAPARAATLAAPIAQAPDETELQLLWNHASLKGKQLIAVLLNGLTLEEASMLQEVHLDFEQNLIRVPGNSRVVAITPGLRALLQQSADVPAWTAAGGQSTEELDVLLQCLATDADLPADRVSAETIRESYLLHLVRQGIRLSELSEIAGPVSASALSAYRAHSPAGPGKSLYEIDPVHPLLRG